MNKPTLNQVDIQIPYTAIIEALTESCENTQSTPPHSFCQARQDYMLESSNFFDSELRHQMSTEGSRNPSSCDQDMPGLKKSYAVTTDEARHKFIQLWNNGTCTIKQVTLKNIFELKLTSRLLWSVVLTTARPSLSLSSYDWKEELIRRRRG